jgi:hypothetical protein
MRSIRTIGLAAVVALVAMSAIGVASASAEPEAVFCKVNVEKCTGANYLGYEFSGVATGVKLKFSESGTVQCGGNMVRGEGEFISTLSFTSCTEGCTVTAKGLPYFGNIYEPISGNGKLSMTVSLATKCGTSECVYSGSPSKIPVEGGTLETSAVRVNETLNEEAKSLLCPKSVQWEGEYKLKKTAYVTKRATGHVFCALNTTPCPAESTRLKNEFTLLSKTNLVISSLGGGIPVTCTGAGFHLDNVEIHEPKDTWNYEASPITGCTASNPSYTGCTAALEGSPFVSSLAPDGKGNGTINVTASPKTPTLSLACKLSGAAFTCKFTSTGFAVKFTGGEPAKLTSTINMTRLSGPGGVCLESVTMSAEYQSTALKTLFMTSS